MTVKDDILSMRHPGVGYNPTRFVELYGAEMVPMSRVEPDPNTFRSEYYYNTRQNALYRKLPTDDSKVVWKRIGG